MGFYFCSMNVLVLGSGGREHALAWKLAQSERCKKLLIAPGNAGTLALGENVALNPERFDEVADCVRDHKIDLLVVGPEAPLVSGIREYFEERPSFAQLRIIGPGKAGAMLEGSKDFAKAFMQRHDIPTARYKSFGADEMDAAVAFLEEMQAPYVLKADGLAAGKGVLIIDKLEEAKAELKAMLGGKFGEASSRVVIEEFLDGMELSVFVLTDGKNYVLLPEAKDYKRIGNGDTGLNTGGMGAVSPVLFANTPFMEKVREKILEPTIDGLGKDGIPYVGFLFIGLIKVGLEPYVIEYNVRMGDPETQVVLPRLREDLLTLMEAACKGKIGKNRKAQADPRSAVCVVKVSGGYPGDYEKGKEIHGLGENGEAMVFHAGTAAKDGKVLSAGGRVLAVSAYGKDLGDAMKVAYRGAESIDFEKAYMRKDIGGDLRG